MSTVAELLTRAAAAGVAVETRAARLYLRGKRETEPLMRAILARKAEVLAVLAGCKLVPPAPSETDSLLAEVLALRERVQRVWWRGYIDVRLEVDAGSPERLRRIIEWVKLHPDAFEPCSDHEVG